MPERKPVGKKLRFDVFKRDGFQCQYCGSCPPEVVLEVDHIKPVSKGGTNQVDNMITACFDCNRGKSNGLLEVSPETIAEKAERMEEKREQLKAFERLQRAERRRQDKAIDKLEGIFKNYHSNRGFTDKFKNDIRRHFLPRISVFQLEDAMEIAMTRVQGRPEDSIKYFCGVCWAKIRALQ